MFLIIILKIYGQKCTTVYITETIWWTYHHLSQLWNPLSMKRKVSCWHWPDQFWNKIKTIIITISSRPLLTNCWFPNTCAKFSFFSFMHFWQALDTFGDWQRPVFSLDVSKDMHKTKQNFNILESIGHWSCKRLIKKKTPFCPTFCAFRFIIKGLRSEVFYYLIEKLSLSHRVCYFIAFQAKYFKAGFHHEWL